MGNGTMSDWHPKWMVIVPAWRSVTTGSVVLTKRIFSNLDNAQRYIAHLGLDDDDYILVGLDNEVRSGKSTRAPRRDD
jgi:hypothetical protein